jgi:hypothetical protein
MRRYEEFKRNESVKLVKEYLTCTDELTSICLVLKGKIAMLNQLLNNVATDEKKEFIRKDDRDSGSCESAKERIEWALEIIKDQNSTFESLLEDLRLATQAVSLENNPFSIMH